MNLSDVSPATLQRVLDALPYMTNRFVDGPLRASVDDRNLPEVLVRLEKLGSQNLSETERARRLAEGDPRYLDGLLAPAILQTVTKMLAVTT